MVEVVAIVVAIVVVVVVVATGWCVRQAWRPLSTKEKLDFLDSYKRKYKQKRRR